MAAHYHFRALLATAFAVSDSVPTIPAPRYLVERLLLIGSLLLFGIFVAYALYGEHAAIDREERLRLATQARVVHDVLVRQIDATNRVLQAIRADLPRWGPVPTACKKPRVG